MKLLTFLFYLICISPLLSNTYKGKTYIVTNSTHSWFRKNFSEYFESSDFVVEDTNFDDEIPTANYVYRLRWFEIDKVKMVELQMARFDSIGDFNWWTQKYTGIVNDTKTGFTIHFDNGNVTEFTELQHFIL